MIAPTNYNDWPIQEANTQLINLIRALKPQSTSREIDHEKPATDHRRDCDDMEYDT